MRGSSISRFCAAVRVAAESAERLKVTLKCHHRTLLHMHGEKKQLMSNYAQQQSQRSICIPDIFLNKARLQDFRVMCIDDSTVRLFEVTYFPWPSPFYSPRQHRLIPPRICVSATLDEVVSYDIFWLENAKDTKESGELRRKRREEGGREG